MNLREELETKRLSQRQFSKLLGVHPTTITKWINKDDAPAWATDVLSTITCVCGVRKSSNSDIDRVLRETIVDGRIRNGKNQGVRK